MKDSIWHRILPQFVAAFVLCVVYQCTHLLGFLLYIDLLFLVCFAVRDFGCIGMRGSLLKSVLMSSGRGKHLSVSNTFY